MRLGLDDCQHGPSAPSSGYLTLNQGAFTNVVDVNTYMSGGIAVNQPFMLTLFC